MKSYKNAKNQVKDHVKIYNYLVKKLSSKDGEKLNELLELERELTLLEEQPN